MGASFIGPLLVKKMGHQNMFDMQLGRTSLRQAKIVEAGSRILVSLQTHVASTRRALRLAARFDSRTQRCSLGEIFRIEPSVLTALSGS
jgi:hypothetical protein